MSVNISFIKLGTGVLRIHRHVHIFSRTEHFHSVKRIDRYTSFGAMSEDKIMTTLARRPMVQTVPWDPLPELTNSTIMGGRSSGSEIIVI